MNVFLLRINNPKITKMGQYILCESQRCDTRQSSLSPQKHNMNFLTVQRSHLPTTFTTEANEEHRHSLSTISQELDLRATKSTTTLRLGSG